MLTFRYLTGGLLYLTSGRLQSDIQKIISLLNEVLQTMTENQSQLDTALAAEEQVTQTLATDVNASAAISKQLAADFAALLARLPAGTDFTNEVNAINANLTLLQQTDTTAQSAASTDTSTDQSVNATEPAPTPAPTEPAPEPAPTEAAPTE